MFGIFKKEKRDYPIGLINGYTTLDSSLASILSIPSVFACVSLVSNTISALPLEVTRKGLVIPGHRREIDEPVENMTRQTWISTIVRNIMINGNAYVEITPKGYIIQDSINVVLLMNDMGDIIKYQVGNRIVRPEDMLHFRRLTKDERGQVGISLIDTFSTLWSDIVDTQQHISGYMKNGIMSGMWLEINGRASTEKMEKIRKAFKNLYQGVANRTSMPVLTDEMKLHEIKSNTLKDSDVDKLRSMQLLDVAMIFNIPISLLDGSGNYGSTVEANLMFLKSCINPILKNIEAELNLKLNTGTDIKYRFDTSAYLAGSFAQQIQTLSTSVNSGILTQNEARERLGYAAKSDGDILYAPAGTPTTDKKEETKK